MVVGVVGGGQLGRMLGLAGIPLGHSFVFLDPDPACPASAVGPVVQGAYDDPAALLRLAERVDVATFEFENVPAAAVEALAARVPTAPGARSLAVSQDRIAEKEFFRACGIRVQPFEAVNSEAELAAACGRVGTPAVLKTRRFGYDGKGQAVARSPLDLPDAWRAVGGAPCIYEAFVDFECEVSAVVVRARDGDLRGWTVGRNEHRGGILRRTVVPAPGVDAAIAAEAQRAAGAVAEALGHVGVLAVEFFVTADGLVANEMAPRVHNSAHWSIDGAVTSQFANHVRAVCDEPLGSTDLLGPSAMVNLVGSMPDRADLLAVPGARLHDYAKAPRPGRKIGHVNVCAPDERVRDAQLRVLEELVERAAGVPRAGGAAAPGAGARLR